MCVLYPGNYVIVEPIPEGDKVKGEIVAVLMADHIKHLKKIGKWSAECNDDDDDDDESVSEAQLYNTVWPVY